MKHGQVWILVSIFALIWQINFYRMEAQPQDTVNIHVSNELGKADQAAPFLEVVQDNLESKGIHLISSEDLSPNIVLRPYNDDPTQISVEVRTPQTLSLSPILLGRLETLPLIQNLEIEPVSEEFDFVSSLVTVLALYSIMRCDLAVPMFEETASHLLSYAVGVNGEQPLDDMADLARNRRELTLIDVTNYMSFFWGNCELINGSYEQAIEKLDRSYAYHVPENAPYEAPTNLAWAYLQIGNTAEAFSDNTWRVLDAGRVDTRVKALMRRAMLYASIFRYNEAIEDLNFALEIVLANRGRLRSQYYVPFTDEDIVDLYILRGQIYLNMYEWDKSLEDFNSAIEFAPDYADAYFQRGVLYYSILQTGQELREEALTNFQHYLELAPDGEYADQAREYAAKIEAELAALNE